MARTLDPTASTPGYLVYRVDDGARQGWDWELRAGSEEAARVAIEVALTDRIADLQGMLDAAPALVSSLDGIIGYPDLPAVPAGTLTVAQLSSIVRVLRDEGQATRDGAQSVAEHLKTTVGALVTVTEQLHDLLRFVRGDFS